MHTEKQEHAIRHVDLVLHTEKHLTCTATGIPASSRVSHRTHGKQIVVNQRRSRGAETYRLSVPLRRVEIRKGGRSMTSRAVIAPLPGDPTTRRGCRLAVSHMRTVPSSDPALAWRTMPLIANGGMGALYPLTLEPIDAELESTSHCTSTQRVNHCGGHDLRFRKRSRGWHGRHDAITR